MNVKLLNECRINRYKFVRWKLDRLNRKNHMPAPILVISGNNGIYDKITSFGVSGGGFLSKPSDLCRLAANVEAIIRQTYAHSSAAVNVGNPITDLSGDNNKIGEKWHVC